MNGDLILIIPILLILVAIMFLVRHMRGGSDDSIAALIGIVPIVIIIGVAIGIIVSMASIADPWEWDADSKTLTIDGNIHDTGLSYPWTGYANQVETLVIEPGVEFVQGPAFARMTNLEYVDIAEGVTLDEGAFSQTFKDPLDANIAMSDVAGYEYVGFGDGTLYLCDPGVFTYTSGGKDISGLASGYSEARYLVIPAERNGIKIEGIAQGAFTDKTTVIAVISHPDCTMSMLGINSFSGCTSLARISIPTVTTIDSNAFINTAITEVSFPLATIIGSKVFSGCASLMSVELPNVVSIYNYAFENCTSLRSVTFANAETVGTSAFTGCSSLESVSLPAATSLGLNSFNGCAAIVEFSAPRLVTIETNALRGTAITEASFQFVTTLEANAFQNCAALERVDLPAITTIGSGAFIGCTGIESVGFGSGLSSVTANAMQNWTFYGSDGNIQIDKTVASNLAGKTFRGTAAALVEVINGAKSLTPDQLQKVHLHDAELERIKMEAISIGPLPFELQDA